MTEVGRSRVRLATDVRRMVHPSRGDEEAVHARIWANLRAVDRERERWQRRPWFLRMFVAGARERCDVALSTVEEYLLLVLSEERLLAELPALRAALTAYLDPDDIRYDTYVQLLLDVGRSDWRRQFPGPATRRPRETTRRISRIAVMSVIGSPATRSRSASSPGRSRPVRSANPQARAAWLVAEASAVVGGTPAAASSTMAEGSRPWRLTGLMPESTPLM